MFQHVISCVAAFWMHRNTTLSTVKSSFFLYIFSHTHTQHFRVGVLSFFVGGIWTSLWFFSFPSSLPGGSFFASQW